MRLRRDRFGELVRRQLDLFEQHDGELVRDADAAERAYDDADRDNAEEAYADFQLAVEAAVERLEEIREAYAATLDDDARRSYEQAFARAARKRFPKLTAAL